MKCTLRIGVRAIQHFWYKQTSKSHSDTIIVEFCNSDSRTLFLYHDSALSQMPHMIWSEKRNKYSEFVKDGRRCSLREINQRKNWSNQSLFRFLYSFWLILVWERKTVFLPEWVFNRILMLKSATLFKKTRFML